MKVIAVIASPTTFVEWAKARQTLDFVNKQSAAGRGWTAHRIDHLDMPWQGPCDEVVFLPIVGTFKSPVHAVKRSTQKAAA